MALDLTKPVQTRRGGKVTVWDAAFKHTASDAPTVHGKEEFDGMAYSRTWRTNGKWNASSGRHYLDLVNVPEKRTLDVWVNVYPNEAAAHATRKLAEDSRAEKCIACVHIVKEYTVGEGL